MESQAVSTSFTNVMIEFFFGEVVSFWHWLLPILQSLVWPGVTLVVIVYAVRTFSPKGAIDQVPSLRRSAQIVALLVIIGILATFQSAGLRSVMQYRAQQTLKRFDSQEIVAGKSVNQSMPTVSIRLIDKKRTTHKASSSELESYRNVDGVDFVAYMKSRGFTNPKILSTAVANGLATIDAEYETSTTESVTLTTAKINAKLEPVNDSDQRANAYSLNYEGTFEWQNSTTKPGESTFSFQLPDHDGTISDISVSINGKKMNETDSEGYIERTTSLTPGEKVQAVVSYSTKGRGNFRLYPSDGLRSIQNLAVHLVSSADLRFERGSLTPTERGKNTYDWAFDNTITRQIISIAIPFARGTQEVWFKLGYLAPLSLIAFGGLLIFFESRNLSFATLAGAICAYGLGLSLPLGFASANVPPIGVGIATVALATAVAAAILRARGTLPLIVGGGIMTASFAGPLSVLLVLTVGLVAAISLGRSANSHHPA